MTNRNMEKCSTSIIIRELQIKPTVRYHFTSVRMSITQKTKISAGEDVKHKGLLVLWVGI